ncbi:MULTISPECIES: succinylglutamate desuccinylase/aspartoacylase family protein [Salinivibrio]|uniref:Deacylase n=1 Tax=Salinivibrio siamensis TaxID=414286 RepID=A0ABX3K6M8_9GAMM|nr:MULTISPECIES: succinylglutamate desuccinylase/aspartoacylase family protein [Salinivibrio]KKA43389.1 deacylase [Salinivibrio sp. KP-1]OOE64488.1 deacylase [Salinivibrio sp. IB868]OOE72835.1 deacylase [Salinivibrio sp. IB870]OOE73365.1 deacylase [Salinivibrio sp. ML290]OOE77934.1 deacylase [Salinivibrio sp. ML198]
MPRGRELVVRAKRNNAIDIGGETVNPGDRLSLELEIAKLYTHAPLNVSIEVLNGKLSGPTLLICAAIHGDELNGIEIVRQIMARTDTQKLRGTIVAIPVVNVFGFIHKSRYLPDRRDLNRSFPGSERGSIAGRMAYQLFNEVISQCTHVIDLHTAAIHRTNLPQIRANLDNPEAGAMATAFSAPVVVDAALRGGSLRAEAEAIGIPVITYEAGEALRFEPYAINAGVRGVIRVMRHLGMLRQSRRKLPYKPVTARATRWVRADADGIFRSHIALGEMVSKQQVIGIISDPAGSQEVEVIAPQSGILIGQQTLPVVNEGDAIFHIAFFSQSDDLIEQHLEGYRDQVKDDQDDELKWGIGTLST